MSGSVGVLCLNALSAAAALVAAFFWFRSAAGAMPPIVTYWDRTPLEDPYYQAVLRSLRSNRIAAVAAGVSALFMAVALLIPFAHRQ
jgi:hypothetical protein